MALGDGIRRNLATVSKEERNRLRDAILQLNQKFYPGATTDTPPGHVSHWFKQDEIHDSSHVHGCPAFLPWHREMCNRFEALIREIDPELSLHYWDWNLDPSNMPDGDGGIINLFDADFMGNADGSVNGGEAGEPLLSAGFYNPNAAPNNREATLNPADPIISLTRDKRSGKPPVGGSIDGFNWPSDSQLLNASSWEEFNDLMIGIEIPGSSSNNGAHAGGHSYIGGLLIDAHTSFRDPFVFFLHANVDRLWAMWQRLNPSVRLDPNQLYGTQSNSKGSGDVARFSQIGEFSVRLNHGLVRMRRLPRRESFRMSRLFDRGPRRRTNRSSKTRNIFQSLYHQAMTLLLTVVTSSRIETRFRLTNWNPFCPTRKRST